ncbi:MAG: hypothetical protein EBZ77_13935, partial [Chitinophagia bacterium]|nr:hypothetical protein [Chitinophagia bacterium]
MKNYLLLLILLATSMPSAAQMVTSLQLPYTAGYATAPRYRVHRLVCATTKIGAALTVTGPVVFFVGKGLIEDYAHNQNL